MEFANAPIEQFLVAILVVVNVGAFFLMGYDKRQAVRGRDRERTPEGCLFFLAAAFGSVGVYLGMQVFRHKTKHWYFQLGIPLLMLQNLATVFLLMGWVW